MVARMQKRSPLFISQYGSGKGFVNTLIDKLPFPLHFPGYHYLGPGTPLEKHIQNHVQPINKLDALAREHDIAYAQYDDKQHRREADLKLLKKASKRILSRDAYPGERFAALLTTGAMGLKRLSGSGTTRRNRKKKTKRSGRGTLKNRSKILRRRRGRGVQLSSSTPIRRRYTKKGKRKLYPQQLYSTIRNIH